MKKYELIAPCHFGLEAVLKREITDLGYDVSRVEDGRRGGGLPGECIPADGGADFDKSGKFPCGDF